MGILKQNETEVPKTPYFIKKILFPSILFCAVFLLVLNVIKDKEKAEIKEKFMLKSYKNTVALYKNDELIRVYNNIVLNTLPQKDIQSFNKGIPVSNEIQAELMLEDYDG